MNKLLEGRAHRYDYWFHLANSLRSLGRHEQAAAAIDNAISADPTNPLYQMHKAQSLALLKTSSQV